MTIEEFSKLYFERVRKNLPYGATIERIYNLDDDNIIIYYIYGSVCVGDKMRKKHSQLTVDRKYYISEQRNNKLNDLFNNIENES